MGRQAFISIMAAVMTPLAAAAQAPLSVHPEKIKPYEAMWRVTVTRPDGSKVPQGLWTDQVIFTSYKGHEAIRRVQGVTYVNGQTFTWVNVLDAKTLRPLMHVEHAPKGEVFTRDFADDAVTTHHNAPDGAALDSARTPLTGAVYDYPGRYLRHAAGHAPAQQRLLGDVSLDRRLHGFHQDARGHRDRP